MSPTTLLDFRKATGNNVSLDLARHLPCRLQAGKVLVIADNPRIFSSVLCRRWTAILKEVELQACLTMDRTRKQLFRHELERLQHVRVSSKDSKETTVLVLTPQTLARQQPQVATIYFATVTGSHTLTALNLLQPGGLAVVYQAFWEDFSRALQRHIIGRQQSKKATIAAIAP